MRITPSRFSGDPTGHVLNQIGHGLLGAGSVALLPLSLWSALVAAVGYFVLIEVPQIRANNTRRVKADSVEDALHFTMGALLLLTGAVWAAVAWLIVLGIGAWRRR